MVSLFPLDDERTFTFGLHVSYTGNGKWKIWRYSYMCYTNRGNTVEDHPRFRRYTRFDLDTAIELAKQFAPNVGVAGMTAQDVYDGKVTYR